MKPVKITAFLATSLGVARSQDSSLDGLLASQAIRHHYAEAYYYLPNPAEHLEFVRLPLELRGKPSREVERAETGYVLFDAASRTKDESLWYWSCSSAQMIVRGRDTHHWVKRFNAEAALADHIKFRGVEKIIIEQGRFKAYYMPNPMLVAQMIWWYASGIPEEIALLVCHIPAIGKKRSQGEGHILRWQVEEIPDDYSEWRDGQLMRPIPGLLVDHAIMTPLDMQHIAFRAPQWHPLNQAMCVTKAVRRG